MTAAVAPTTNMLTEQQLNLILQYTVEAYKTFEKLAENLPNPVAAQMFKAFAVDEREARDLIELKIIATGSAPRRSSSGRNSRPTIGATPRTDKNPAETCLAFMYSGSPGALTFVPVLRIAAMLSNERAARSQSRKSG